MFLMSIVGGTAKKAGKMFLLAMGIVLSAWIIPGGELLAQVNADPGNPIGINSIGDLISTIIKYLLGLVAALSVLFIVIGGVRMVASGGSEKNITSGKKTLQWATIGLVVSLLAFTAVNIIQSVLKVK